MADAGSALAGAGSGALAGSSLGPWGAVAGGTLGLLGSLLSGNQGAQQQADVANANLAQEQNNQRYSQSLNALAMQRAISGTSDNLGDTTYYDPTTNTWQSKLGALPLAAQTSALGASTLHNTTDVPRATYANAEAALRASENNRFTSGSLNAFNNYTPTTSAGMLGNLQQATTLANNNTYRPLVADTLRQFARTGTAAGPVLADIGKASANSLAQQMAQNTIQAPQAAASINATNRASLGDMYKTNVAASNPSFSYAPDGSENPMNTITSLLASRAQGAAQPASAGAYSAAIGSNAGTNASTLAASKAGMGANALGGQLTGVGNSISGILKGLGTNQTGANGQPVQGSSPWGQIMNMFSSPGAGNAGDGAGIAG